MAVIRFRHCANRGITSRLHANNRETCVPEEGAGLVLALRDLASASCSDPPTEAVIPKSEMENANEKSRSCNRCWGNSFQYFGLY